mgnify:CR=1 FL=1
MGGLASQAGLMVAFKSVQQGHRGIIIRVDDQVYRTLSRRRGPGRSFNDVLRRLFGLPFREKWIRRKQRRV